MATIAQLQTAPAQLTATAIAEWEPPAAAQDESPARPATAQKQVLVLRCCRLPQFERAIALVREAHPGASIWALTSPDFAEPVRRLGVDHVVIHKAKRLRRRRAGAPVRALRHERFDLLVIPYMNNDGWGYTNVHQFALGIRALEYMLVPATIQPRCLSRHALRHLDSVARWDGWRRHLELPLMLGGLLLAAVAPRRRRAGARPGVAPRVLHVITSLGAGGAQVQMGEVVSRSRLLGFEPEVLVLNRADGDFSLRHFPPDVPVTYMDSWPRLFGMLSELYERCRDGNYDVVHTWLFFANFLGAAAARLAGGSVIVTSVRNLSLWKRTWYRRWWFRLADVLAGRTADVVTVNATALAPDHAAWARMDASRIVVIPNGLTPEKVFEGTDGARAWLRDTCACPRDAVVVGTVGRLAHEKDQATFIRAFAQLRRHHDIRGVIVGDGELRVTLQQLAADLGVGDSLTFLGSRLDARRVIAGLDLFLLTSAIEGFPNVLLEAVMLGVPAVASDAGGAADVLGGRQAIFDVGGTDRAVVLSAEALSDLPSARRWADHLRVRALDEFTADRTAGRWASLYRMLGVQGGYRGAR